MCLTHCALAVSQLLVRQADATGSYKDYEVGPQAMYTVIALNARDPGMHSKASTDTCIYASTPPPSTSKPNPPSWDP